MPFRSAYGGLYPIITSREMNRIYEIIQTCGIDMGVAYILPHDENPMLRMIEEFDSDITKLSTKQFIHWLGLVAEQLLEWVTEQRQFESEEIRWSQEEIKWSSTWDTSKPAVIDQVEKTQVESEENMRVASFCLQDLQRIKKNVEQRYRQQSR